MSILFALVRQETHSWINTAVFYAYILLFVFFSLAGMFLLSHFLEANEASLGRTFFQWHPWIFALTAPVISIRSWSEEHHCGLFEVLGTQPVSMLQVVIAKSIGGALVVFIGLALTFPAIVTVLWLGSPDIGIIVAGYLGSFLLGVTFVVLSQAVCASMQGSIGAYVLSVGVCFIFILSGNNQIADIIVNTFPALEWTTHVLSAVSIATKFRPFVEGRVEVASIAGLMLLIAVAIALTFRAIMVQRVVAKKTKGTAFRYNYSLSAPFILSLYLVFAMLINLLPGYFDATQNNRFGLPQAVKDGLLTLERNVTVRLYATLHHPKFGFELNNYKQRIEEVVNLISLTSQGTVVFDLVDPSINSQSAQMAEIDEIEGVQDNSGSDLVFSLVIESLDNKKTFNNVSPSRQNHLIADLIQAILDVSTNKKKRIGVISPFNNDPSSGVSMQYWSALDTLDSSFHVENIEVIDSEINTFDTLVFLHDKPMNSQENSIVSQYMTSGGNVVVFADPYSQMYATFSENQSLEGSSSSLPNFVSDRGIYLTPHKTLYDFNLATEQVTQRGSVANAALLTLRTSQINPEHSISAGFDFLQFLHAGALEVEYSSKYNTTELLRTSIDGKAIATQLSHDNDLQAIELEIGNISNEAKSHSIMLLQETVAPSNEGRLIVTSDIDWLHSAISGDEDANGNFVAYNANVQLTRSIFDFLAGNPALKELRQRGALVRPLHHWSDIKSQLTAPFSSQIASKITEISAVEERINIIEQALLIDSNPDVGSKSLMLEHQSLNKEIRISKAELSNLRRLAQSDITKMRNLIKWSNILVVPLIIAFLGMFLLHRRAKRVRGIRQ